jgi:hypothetical protein
VRGAEAVLAARRSAAVSRAVFARSPVGMAVTDGKGLIVEANPARSCLRTSETSCEPSGLGNPTARSPNAWALRQAP